MSSHLQVVRTIYQAFATGDVPTILAQLSPDIDWEYSMAANGVPWLQHQRGLAGVGAFFGALGEHLDFEGFVVKEMLEGDALVVVLIDLEARVKRNGRKISERDEVHVWRFDGSGKVVCFRHALDSWAHSRAWEGGAG